MINKVYCALFELKLDTGSADQSFDTIMESANIIAAYPDPLLGDVQFKSASGTIAFRCGLRRWGFTVGKFAAKFNREKSKMMKRGSE